MFVKSLWKSLWKVCEKVCEKFVKKFAKENVLQKIKIIQSINFSVMFVKRFQINSLQKRNRNDISYSGNILI